MANTTKDESPKPRELSVAEVQAKEVNARYQKGENLYVIAKAVFGFDGEEAVDAVRAILNQQSDAPTNIPE